MPSARSKITVLHYADPWCWKCWGLEPVIQRLNEVYGDQVEVVYKTGGLFERLDSWIAEEGLTGYEDLETWIKQSKQEMRIPFDASYLTDTRPESSWPACVAVEAAWEQGSRLGYEFYRSLIEAIQLLGKDGSDKAVQVEVARTAGLDVDRFVRDLDDPKIKARFLAHRQAMNRAGMNFSSLVIADESSGKSVKVSGYEPGPYEQAIDELVGGRFWKRSPIDIIDYIERRKGHLITAREISSVFSVEERDALRRLEALSNAGILKQTELPQVGVVWSISPTFSSPSLTLEQVELAHVIPMERATKPVELERILRPVIKRLYSDVSREPQKGFHFPVGRDAALLVGYPRRELDRIPETAVESFAGVGYPFAAAVIRKGDAILDVGSGSGTDVLISALKTGPEGDVTGLDFTESMIRKAEANIAKSKTRNAKIVKGEATKIPLPGESVDVVTSNGVLNLVPNKERALREIFRTLKPKGHFQIADILTKGDVTATCGVVPQLWAECIGGAAVETDFIGLMKTVGFEGIRSVRRMDYFSASPSPEVRRLAATFGADSVVIRATKP